MRITSDLIWIFLIVAILIFISFLKDKKPKIKKIIFFGDSLTQLGVLPGGYITLIRQMLAQQNINNYELIGAGISGNKIYDLYSRVHKDVIAHSPDIVVLWIGVNDVWNKNDADENANSFEKYYKAVVNELLANKIQLMLVTPAVIGEKKDFSNPLDEDLNEYVEIIKSIAAELKLHLCDLRFLFHVYEIKYNKANADSGILTIDGVHLNDAGEKLAAQEILKVLREV